MSMLHQDGQDIVDPTGGEIGAGPESVEVEVEEDEYANAPDPSVHTSTTDMINQGNDLNRPKKQFTRAQPGDNPMAAQTPMQETRELLKQYASILKDLRTK
jgi:alpha-D-ribose 1-methylphosphonate 5-triphosphate synthase subunit PhnI